VSALSGVSKGIQLVNRYNIILPVLLIGYILFFGPRSFIIDGYVQSVGRMVDNFFPMALYRGDTGWVSWWTAYFWGWFIGSGPLMATVNASFSWGRTNRHVILSISIVAPLIPCFFFIIGVGSGLPLER
ncbi:BCCT transporter, partial [Vibrio parahaemolyticus]|uniref:BCCT family transporter n=1 Tax=Vibrio parahaemolyticus TaxID=670 RepID=UPI00062B086F